MKNTSPGAQLLNWCGHRITIFARYKDSKTNNFIVLFFWWEPSFDQILNFKTHLYDN